jgi:hypothetical protein
MKEEELEKALTIMTRQGRPVARLVMTQGGKEIPHESMGVTHDS